MIRKIIKAKIGQKDLAIGTVAAKAAIPRSSAWRFVNGQRDISGDRAAKLLHALGVKIGGKSALELRGTIKERFTKLKVSARQFSQQIGVTDRVLSHYLEGKRDSATAIIDKIIAGLKISIG